MKFFLFFLISITSQLVAQYLPLQIGNEWHYNQGLGPKPAHFSRAIDTTIINSRVYYKIEDYYLNPIYPNTINFDRMDGDSIYYRFYNNSEKVLFNFNWNNGQIISTPNSNDSNCVDLKLIYRDSTSAFGISTYKYQVFSGGWCFGMPDTGWTLSCYQYLKYFGCLDADDGSLIGARINGTIYGNLHPVPVELLSFSSKVISNSIKLEWSTATEKNNYGFEILRRFSNVLEFKVIDFVDGNGSTTQLSRYEFLDDDLVEGDYQYQLIQVDYDGSRRQIAETEESIIFPYNFYLSQNYPNPFNPVTSINFSILQKSKVELVIYNTLGQKISLLVDDQKEAGSYTVTFNAVNLPSGVYFYRISAGNFNETKKLILIK